ncbi:GNAT family N-acetyltransferase [Akkermansiaceae bacterium]|nr:GNAT family N-acetyltransferase [Akkermansiaceae bacterium]
MFPPVQSDLRAVLQYVPSFRGKIFVLVVDAASMTELALAEALLDLTALQQVGVKLVIVSVGSGEAELEQRLIDGEIKWQSSALVSGEAEAILNRGQLAFVKAPGLNGLSDELVEFASAVGAAKLIVFLPSALAGIHAISREDAAAWSGGDADLFHAAAKACERGIPRVHLLDQTHQGVLMDELFSNEGVGVMVHADDYLTVRPIEVEDIPELLAMIGRSMRDAHLVPRSYEEIESGLGDFLVMTVDGNVVGCVALHPSESPHCAEVACLYVKQNHGGLGYGQLLVTAAEERAREQGIPWVFALSNRAADYFTGNLGYQEVSVSEIPGERQERLRASGRQSTVIRKFV